MLKLSVTDLIRGDENCYSFVVAISKRARQIADNEREEELISDEKPVQQAVDEYMEGKFAIVQPDLEEEVQREDDRVDRKLAAAMHGTGGADADQTENRPETGTQEEA